MIEGSFANNQANGDTHIVFANGDDYTGNVIREVMTGEGQIFHANGKNYTGTFRDG